VVRPPTSTDRLTTGDFIGGPCERRVAETRGTQLMRVSALSKGIVRCMPELRSAIETLAPHLASQLRLRRLLFPVGPGALFVAMVGQFRSAGGLVLLSGRILGAQIFLPVAYQAKMFGGCLRGGNRPLSLRIG
jgi:hypothetical protein